MALRIRIATTERELAGHHEVRRATFVDEQGVFRDSDLDRWDESALRVVAEADERIVGAVRLYALDEFGLWKGDRLAVVPEARGGVGARLVRFAVATAGERGGRLMVARVQLPNVAFFQKLGWSAQGAPKLHHGLPHQEMLIPLTGTVTRREPSLAWATG